MVLIRLLRVGLLLLAAAVVEGEIARGEGGAARSVGQDERTVHIEANLTQDDLDVLRRLAEEIEHDLQSIKDTNRIEVTGGRPRQIRVELDPEALGARRTTPLEVAWAIDISNKLIIEVDAAMASQ